jgi:hypothetical protein
MFCRNNLAVPFLAAVAAAGKNTPVPDPVVFVALSRTVSVQVPVFADPLTGVGRVMP